MDLAADYILLNDIDLSSVYEVQQHWPGDSAGRGFIPVGNSSFTGTFDGQNNVITNLFINRPTVDSIGLFGITSSSAEIKNVGLIDVFITGDDQVGALVGNSAGLIDNAFSTGIVRGVGGISVDVGGLVGRNNEGDIKNSYSEATVIGDDFTGGLVGFNRINSELSDSYSSGPVYGQFFVGGLAGVNSGDIENSYSTSAVTARSVIGGLVGENSATGSIENTYSTGFIDGNGAGGLLGTNNGTVIDSFWDKDTSGQSTSAGGAGAIGKTTSDLLDINTYTAGPPNWSFGNIAGSGNWFMIDGKTRPFLQSEFSTTIRNAHELQLIALNLSEDYVLADNLKLKGLRDPSQHWPLGPSGRGFVPIGNSSFSGSFDGGGHLIEDLYIDRPSEDNVGLFGEIGLSGSVKDLGIVDAFIIGDEKVGALAGFGRGTISESYSSGMILGSDRVGGLVGSQEGFISDSYSTAIAIGETNVGGLIGALDGSGIASNVYSTGSVIGSDSNAGGLIGRVDTEASVEVAFSSGRVTGDASFKGGLIGRDFSGDIEDSFWDKDTSGQSTSAGLPASSGKTTSEMLTQSTYVGFDFDDDWFMIDGKTRPFLQSEYSQEIRNLHQLQLMAMDLNVDYNLIDNIYIDPDFINDPAQHWPENLGGKGFVPIGNSAFSGAFNGNKHVIAGLFISRPTQDFVGLFGRLSANALIRQVGLLDSYVLGEDFVGGLAGENLGAIKDSYNEGIVIGETKVGGLVGENQNVITTSYSSGLVRATVDTVGGLVGRSTGTIDNVYSTATVEGPVNVGGLVGRYDGGTILKSISSGLVNNGIAGPGVGGVLGFAFNTGSGLLSIRWDEDSSGQLTSAGTGAFNQFATPFSTQELLSENVACGLLQCGETPNSGLWFMVRDTVASGSDPRGKTRVFLQMEYNREIHNVNQLQLMLMDLEVNYELANDIDMSATHVASEHWPRNTFLGSDGFFPIGNSNLVSGKEIFLGSLEGNGYELTGMLMNRPNLSDVGLFGEINNGAFITGVGLNDAFISGDENVGGLVGKSDGLIDHAYIRGSEVSGVDEVGGLVGRNDGSIFRSYSDADVSGETDVGGFAGTNSNVITLSYSSGDVEGETAVGGFVGSNDGDILDSYSTGEVRGSTEVGGFAGENTDDIKRAFSSGRVIGLGNSGGFIGDNTGGSLTDTYWDIDTSAKVSGVGDGGSAGLTGLTTSAALVEANYTGFNFGDAPSSGDWFMIDGKTRPFLQMEYTNEIRNAHELQLMSMDLETDYKLLNDIDMSLVSDPAQHWAEKGFVPVGNSAFTGSFAGQGHKIVDLFINRPDEDAVGLFGEIEAARITDVGLDNVDITGRDEVGGLIGFIAFDADKDSVVQNVYSEGSVSGRENVGGLVGLNEGGDISHAYSAGSVEGNDSVGGLVGDNEISIRDAYSTASVLGISKVGGLVGSNSGLIERTFSTGSVVGASDVGGLAGFNSSGTYVNSFWDIETSGLTTSAGLAPTAGKSTDDLLAASTYTGFSFSDELGKGDWFIVEGKTRPFLHMEHRTEISNAHELQLMALDLSGTYKLVKDIDLSVLLNPSEHWPKNSDGDSGFAPVGNSSFAGHLFGHDHIISGLVIDRPNDSEVGLFGETSALARIADLGLENVEITGDENVGGLVGLNAGRVTETYVSGSVSGDENVGGLVGSNEGSIGRSYNTATVLGEVDSVGGLVGLNETDAVIGLSYSTHPVISSGMNVGGFVGTNDGTITNSYSTGLALGESRVGGFVGFNDSSGDIDKVFSSGGVSGDSDVGGIAGVNDGSISDSFWDTVTSGTGLGVASGGGSEPDVDGEISSDLIDRDTYIDGNHDWNLDHIWFFQDLGRPTTRPFLRMEFNREISNLHQLQLVSMDLDNDYRLVKDIVIDSSFIRDPAQHWPPSSAGDRGFMPIGGRISFVVGPNIADREQFTGTFDGRDHTISDLFINRTFASFGVNIPPLTLFFKGIGLFDTLGPGGVVKNLNLANVDITGGEGTGAVVGRNEGGLIKHVSSDGIIRGTTDLGGLAGSQSSSSTIINSHSDATVIATGTDNVGGLVGTNDDSLIKNSFNTGSVLGDFSVGGLVGLNMGDGEIENSYNIGIVVGNEEVGGLVGTNEEGTIENTYSTGSVKGDSSVGGLVGHNLDSIITSFSSGAVVGISDVGGLVGLDTGGSVTNSFWDIDTSGQFTSAGGTFKPTTTLLIGVNYTGWSFGSTPGSGEWFIIDGKTRAFLQMEYQIEIDNLHALQLMAMDLTTDYELVSDIEIDRKFILDPAQHWPTGSAGGKGFVPVGNSAFDGIFEGNNHVIKGLFIQRPVESEVGLFGATGTGAIIRNIGLTDASILGFNTVGALVGDNEGTKENSFAGGSVLGEGEVGGLVGDNDGSINDAYSEGIVVGASRVGGLVGNLDGSITNAYSTASVRGATSVGGLVGTIEAGGSIDNSYATGSAEASDSQVGGLVGRVAVGGAVSRSYSTGAILGSATNQGGLIGRDFSGAITDSFWGKDTSGQATSAGLPASSGKSTSDMLKQGPCLRCQD